MGTLADDLSSPPLASTDAQAALAGVEPWLDALLGEVDDPADDLVSLDPLTFTPEVEALKRMQVEAALAAFDTPTVIPGIRICGDARLDCASVLGARPARAAPALRREPGDYLGVPDPTLARTAGRNDCGSELHRRHGGPRVPRASPFFVPARHQLELQLVDPGVGANPGHGIDPSSLSVTMQLFSNFGDCEAEIDGVEAATEGTPSDVTSLLSQTQIRRLVTLGGELETFATDERCDVLFQAEVADTLGNGNTDHAQLELIEEGALAFATFEPSGGNVANPFLMSILLTAPFGGTDPATSSIELFRRGASASGSTTR